MARSPFESFPTILSFFAMNRTSGARTMVLCAKSNELTDKRAERDDI